MAYFELSPAYGRDYKSAAQVKADFDANKDFMGDYQLGFSPVNKEQLPVGSVVMLRYKGNRSVTRHEVK